MNKLFKKIYLSTFINSFGSWLTFLAVALVVKEKYGGQMVAWIFLVQTLPAVFFSRSLVRLIPEHLQERYFWVSQFILALNSLIICFSQNLILLYFHLFIGAFIKGASVPLFNTLVGRWVPNDKIDEVFTRIGSIQTATLALAPIAGAWIKVMTSVQLLFFIDAITFIISVVLLKEVLWVKNIKQNNESIGFKLKDLFGTIVHLPEGVPSVLWRALLLWFGFLLLGALINALEFVRFEDLKMNEKMIGYALTAWGVGSLLAFVKKNQPSLFFSFAIFFISLVFFLLTSSEIGAILAFISAGWSSSVVSGLLRGHIQKSVPNAYNALPVWAFANQVTQLINLVAYVGVAVLLNFLGFEIFAVLVAMVGLTMLTVIARIFMMRKLLGSNFNVRGSKWK